MKFFSKRNIYYQSEVFTKFRWSKEKFKKKYAKNRRNIESRQLRDERKNPPSLAEREQRRQDLEAINKFLNDEFQRVVKSWS